jgi:hypothetical protein
MLSSAMNRTRSSTARTLAGLAVLAAAALASCTTYIKPTLCQPDATTCGGIHDARFCQYTAISVDGTDCPELGLVPSKPFCVVTSTACFDTSYAVQERNCRVLRYTVVRDSWHADCPPGTPMFVNP